MTVRERAAHAHTQAARLQPCLPSLHYLRSQANLRKQRADDAEAKRSNLRQLFTERAHLREAQQAEHRASLQAQMWEQYVGEAEYDFVTQSEYEKLSQTPPPGKTVAGTVLAARPPWQTWISSNGWFSSWFGGQRIESTAI